MDSSNWEGVSGTDNKSGGHDQYQLDSVGLQIGINSIGVELLGVSMQMAQEFVPRYTGNFGRRRREQPMQRNNIQQTVDGIPIRNVYITNIGAEVERQDMYNIFNCYGQVVSIFLNTSKNDSSKKFAFVTYEDPSAASRVLKQRKFQDRRGRFMYANPADSWHQPKEGPNGKILWHRNQRNKENNTNEELEVEGETSLLQTVPEIVAEEGLNSLNDDCLLHIFSFLSYKQIAGIERVCKRWQALSFCMWKCLHELSYLMPPFNELEASTEALEQYLVRCGEGLTLLDLTAGQNKFNFNGSTLAVVAKYCVNLEVLRVENLSAGNRSLAHLGRRCPKLKELVLEGCIKYSDRDLKSLLPKCHQLNVLHISQAPVNGQCLLSLEAPITSLKLSKCPNLDMKYVVHGLKKISSTLESLTVSHPGKLTQSHMEELVATVPNLTSFGLSSFVFMFSHEPATLMAISRLSKLVSLDLSQNRAVNDAVITAIVEGCENLSKVSLASSSDITTSTGLSTLARLRKLTDLDISYLTAANDNTFKSLSARSARLKRLVARGCPDLTEEGCIQLVSMCNDLELLDVSGCNNVKDELIHSARTSVKIRTNNVPLKLIVGGTMAAFVKSEELPQLTVDTSDLSSDLLRPDFIDDMYFPGDDSDDDDLDDLCERIAGGWFEDDVDDLDLDELAECMLPYHQFKLLSLGFDPNDFSSGDGDTDYD